MSNDRRADGWVTMYRVVINGRGMLVQKSETGGTRTIFANSRRSTDRFDYSMSMSTC